MKTTRFSIALTYCLVFASTLSAWSAEDNSQQLSRAKQLIDSGKAKPAAAILRELIRSNPKSAEAHMQLGAALAAMAENDKYDDAIAQEEQAIKIDPKSSSAHRILGMIYANQQKFDQSIASLKEACRLQPSSFAAQRDLGKAFLSAGKIDEAIAALKRALEINPAHVETHSKLATILAKKGNQAEALDEANKAVKLAESKAETHLVLANIKLDSGDSAGSIEPFKAAIAANGYDSLGCKNPLTAASALSGLGWAIATENGVSREKLSEALAYQKKAIKAYPGFLNAYIRTADILARQNKVKEADSMYQNLFKSTQHEAVVGIPYSRFLKDAGRNDDARGVLKKVLDKAPENKQAIDALAALEQAKTK